MRKSDLARILATVSLIPLGLASSSAYAQSSDAGGFTTFERRSAPEADGEFVEVGITDVVEREAIGTVEAQIRTLEITDTIFFNEVIETGSDSATRVSFLDDSSLSLGPSSQVIIDRFIYDPAEGTGELALTLTEGVFRFASGTIDDSNYTIDTPVGTIGIRGTVIELSVECIIVIDCAVTMDVVSGITSFDGSDEETITSRGSRMHFRPVVSPEVEVTVLPDDAAPLPGVEDLGARINQSVVDLFNDILPPGVTFDSASAAQLAQAAVQLARENPRLGDLMVEAVALSREDALGVVSSTLMADVPASTPRVVAALSNILGRTPAVVRQRNDSPFGDDDIRDNPIDDEPTEDVADNGDDEGGNDGGDEGGDDGGNDGGDEGGDDGGDDGGDEGGDDGGDEGGDDGGNDRPDLGDIRDIPDRIMDGIDIIQDNIPGR